MQAHELPPPVQMAQLLARFQLSQALYAADHLMAGPAPVAVLTEQTGAHAPSLRRLLRTLASQGVFTEPEPGVFALTPLGQTLTSSQPGSMRDLAITWMEMHYVPFGDLIHTIGTGPPAAGHLYSQPFFTWLSRHPEQATRFTGAMANMTSAIKTAAIASLPLDCIQTIVDLGGADGGALAAILPAHSGMHGVPFDLPHVIADASEALAERGIEDRGDCVAGDFFTSVAAGGDGYLLSVALHDWPDQHARRILCNIAAGSDARPLIIEFVVPSGDTPHISKMIDLTMRAIAGGKERTEPEWRELLTAAGFTTSPCARPTHHTRSSTRQPDQVVSNALRNAIFTKLKIPAGGGNMPVLNDSGTQDNRLTAVQYAHMERSTDNHVTTQPFTLSLPPGRDRATIPVRQAHRQSDSRRRMNAPTEKLGEHDAVVFTRQGHICVMRRLSPHAEIVRSRFAPWETVPRRTMQPPNPESLPDRMPRAALLGMQEADRASEYFRHGRFTDVGPPPQKIRLRIRCAQAYVAWQVATSVGRV